MVDTISIMEGTVKFRDGKKWKSRWCVMKKLSPVADCLHLQLYRDSKDRYKHGQTKASLSLQHFLGVESGFTLDKESNTIAIICQDVIVVLAFDTRERLIQWQVKISNNLGDDIQYLVLISSAPPKTKLSTGPARMHIQDHKFCLTTGVPPRLNGLWEIGHLRRYGVVNGKFCFEGGSSCGKGEGLYIFVTDQSDEITHMLKLASQGRLVTKRRPMCKKISTSDSPRKHLDSMSEHSNNQQSCWPSQESHHLDTNYGCGDTVSVSEGNDNFNDVEFYHRSHSNMERCMSCISKLGAASISRSSTLVGTPGSVANPSWPTIEQQFMQSCCHIHNNHQQNPIPDNMSLGSHGSSNSSEYSVPRNVYTSKPQNPESWYEKPPIAPTNDSPFRRNSPPPNRPPKPKNHKPPMPLPSQSSIGAYENYDIPKSPFIIESENYDTPKKIKEYLVNEEKPITQEGNYGNYDMPNIPMGKQFFGQNENDENECEAPQANCTCHSVMSWADNWINFPYCRRGNSVENTGIPISRIKLSGEGKMPVLQPNGALAIYATVDMAKKISRRVYEESPCECDKNVTTSNLTSDNESNKSNKNTDESPIISDVSLIENDAEKTNNTNYVNLGFEKSLENYENLNILQRNEKLDENKAEDQSPSKEYIKVCQKCLHYTNTSPVKPCENIIENPIEKQENYVMMDAGSIYKNVPGYIPMAPAAPGNNNTIPPLPQKNDVVKRMMDDKTYSNLPVCGPAIDRSRKRCKNERIPGTAMMMLCRNAGSPYNRKQLMNSTDLLPCDKKLTLKKRSASAESSNLLLENCDNSENTDKSPNLNNSIVEGRRCSSPCLHQETELCEDESCCRKITVMSFDADEITITTSQQNYIRRSASVPCKAQNRDSSSSNDSGVSTGSLRQRGVVEFPEFDLTHSHLVSGKKYQRNILPLMSCVHSSLPRRSKSFDPLREISFQFQKSKIPEKSSSAEAEVPVCPPKIKGYIGPNDAIVGQPYVDSRSTSSGTSDMSDYIETLSLSSHSSSDTPDGLRLLRHQPTSTLRPRSGKEYQNIDRSIICLTQQNENFQNNQNLTPAQLRNSLQCNENYTNIAPVPENSESPSPGYQSGTSPQESLQNDHFMFKKEATTS